MHNDKSSIVSLKENDIIDKIRLLCTWDQIRGWDCNTGMGKPWRLRCKDTISSNLRVISAESR